MDKLKDIVIKKIQESGKITFSEYMDMALYYPELGYYQKENPFGIQGSFYTSVNASSSFGNCLGKSFEYIAGETDISNNICEIGAGSGLLANDILSYLKSHAPEYYNNCNYTIVEKSKYLIYEQKKILKDHIHKITWRGFHDLNNFDGIVFSNELVDAFPVHRIINISGAIKELFVIYYDNRLQFYPDSLSSPALKNYIDKFKINTVDKQIIDVNLHSSEWIKHLGSKLKKGFVITIDYGDTSEKLYTPNRMDGTVTCYFKHTQNNDFFERIGYQDITAFIDFSSLISYGAKADLKPITFISQWLYLLNSGILEEIKKAKTDLNKVSIQSLIIPEAGFGTNFNVLMQSKNLETPEDFRYNKKADKIFEELSETYS